MNEFIENFLKNNLGMNKDNVKLVEDDTGITIYEINKEKKSIYIMKDDNNRIKIGASSNVAKRKKNIECSSGLNINVVYHTPLCINWSKIGRNMHRIFKENNIKGEWFNITEKQAIEEIKKQQVDTREYFLTGKKKEFSFAQLERITKIGYSVEMKFLEDHNRFLLNATKEELIKEIEQLFITDKRESGWCTPYVNLWNALYVYFKVFNETKLDILNITIEELPNSYDLFYVSDRSIYDDYVTYLDLLREGIY